MKDTGRTQTVSPIRLAPYKGIGGDRLLTAEEERELGRRIIAGDPDARNELVCRNLPLVTWVVKKKYAKPARSFEEEDLIQEGNLGLITAAEKFDPNRGNRFSTYAIWWICQHIGRALDNKNLTIRVPVHVLERYKAIHAAAKEIAWKNGAVPSTQTIAKYLKAPLTSVENTLKAMRSGLLVSLDAPINGHESNETLTLKDILADGNAMDPTILIEAKQELEAAYATVEKVFQTVRAISRKKQGRNVAIFKELCGFNEEGKQTSLAQVGRDLNVSRECIRKLQQKILREVGARGITIDSKALQECCKSIPELEKITGTSRRLNI